jgi:hypothetical protein
LKPGLLTLERAGLFLSLGSLYAVVLAEWLASPGLWPSSLLEASLLALVLARFVAFLAVPVLRRAKAATIVILFGVDVFVVIGAAAAVLLTGDPSFGSFGRTFMLAWIGAAPMVYPPLAIYLLLRSLGDGTRLSFIIPGAASFFGMVFVPMEAMGAAGGSGGLTGLALLMVSGLKDAGSFQPGGLLVPLSGAVVFVSLLVHATAGARGTGPGRPGGSLALAVAGALFALGWVWAVVPVISSWLALGLPVLGAAGAAWLVTRGK